MPAVDRIPSNPTAPLPEAVDVAVIGGGIIGVSAAWNLAQRGLRVALFEKGRIAGEQSSRNWGWCRQQGRDPAEIPLAVESLRIWRGLDAAVGGDTGFRQHGILAASDDPEDEARWDSWLQHAAPFQLGTVRLTGAEVAARLPASKRRWRSGLLTPSDGHAEPQRAVPAIARAAMALGVAIHETCAVRGIETKAGAVSSVITERGPVRVAAVLLAGGAWSRLFCRPLGVRLKTLNVRASVLRTSPAPDVLQGGFGTREFSVRRRADGGYTVARLGASTYEVVPDGIRWIGDFWPAYMKERKSLRVRFGTASLDEMRWPKRWSMDQPSPFEARRTWDPAPDRRLLSKAFREFRASFDGLEAVTAEESWAGMIDGTPDQVPVISPVAALAGFYVAAGFSGHGFGIGPGAGRLAADLVSGGRPLVDPSPYRFDRFG